MGVRDTNSMAINVTGAGKYQGIHYTDGEFNEGVTHQVEVDRHVEWSVKHDNRLGAE